MKFSLLFFAIFLISKAIAQPLLISKNDFVKQDFWATKNLFCTTYKLNTNIVDDNILLLIKFYNYNEAPVQIKKTSIKLSSVNNIITNFNNSIHNLKNYYPGKTNSYLFDSLIVRDKRNYFLYKGSVVVEVYKFVNKNSNQVMFYQLNKNFDSIGSLVGLDSITKEISKVNLIDQSTYSFKIDTSFLFWRTSSSCKDCFFFHTSGYLFNKRFDLLKFYGRYIKKIPIKNVAAFMQPEFYDDQMYWFLPIPKKNVNLTVKK